MYLNVSIVGFDNIQGGFKHLLDYQLTLLKVKVVEEVCEILFNKLKDLKMIKLFLKWLMSDLLKVNLQFALGLS